MITGFNLIGVGLNHIIKCSHFSPAGKFILSHSFRLFCDFFHSQSEIENTFKILSPHPVPYLKSINTFYRKIYILPEWKVQLADISESFAIPVTFFAGNHVLKSVGDGNSQR